MIVPSPFGGRRWVGDRVDMGQKTVREEIGMDFGGTESQRTKKVHIAKCQFYSGVAVTQMIAGLQVSRYTSLLPNYSHLHKISK